MTTKREIDTIRAESKRKTIPCETCGRPAMHVTNGEPQRFCLDCWRAQQVIRAVGDLDAL